MKRGAKILVLGHDGNACGPFRWTAIREWVAVGYFTPDDQVRFDGETDWRPIGTMPELLATPPGFDTNEALHELQHRARETKAVGPRAAAYLNLLGCPVRPQRLNPYTAFQWVRILEELKPRLANATERWAAEEESFGRAPSASPNDATPAQIEQLRALGCDVPGKLTRLEAHRLISGPPTEGQLRRLRFYGIALPEGACKADASELIDRYVREHWETEEAYQAHRKRLREEAAGRRESAAPSSLQPSAAEVVPDPAGGSPTPVFDPANQADAPQSNRPTLTRGAIVACSIVLGITVATWSISERRSGNDSAHHPPPSPKLQGLEAPAADGQRKGSTAAGPESPNPAQGQGLEAFVMSLKLTGIFGGAEPQASIDGRMYRVGDVVDRARGVYVLRVDPDKLSVVFGDREGKIFERVLR
ncbi:MAG: DUF4339 domain-containing protein [Verrucomicrobia bacterium]|nr:DUF4339 domain-containing protein [Verrucomicrobiota bacterium]